MGLPKEPRQKMINIMYLVLTALLALNVSAEILNAFRVVNESLTTSNVGLSKSTNEIYSSLEGLLNDPKTKEKAVVYKPMADKVKKITAEAYNLIDSYKKKLENEPDENIDAATRLFDTEGEGKNLYAALEKFKKDLIAVDKEMASQITIPLDLKIYESKSGNIATGDKVKDWVNGYFHMTPAVAARTILSKFQNDIKNSENSAASWCLKSITEIKVLMKIEPSVQISSSYLQPGDEVTITSGLAAFNSSVKPTISMDGQSLPVNEFGISETKFNVGAPGQYTKNINVTFVDQSTGQTKTVSKKVEYTVGASSGISVSPTKMNVLYLGVENPVDISAGASSSQLTAQFSGGSIRKSNANHFIAVPDKIGAHSISVFVQGKKVGEANFRVKLLPPPEAYVGNLQGGVVAANVFKAMGGVLAKYDPNITEFDAGFTVTRYTIGANTGGNYDEVVNKGDEFQNALPLVNSLRSGSRVFVSDIYYKGPDGRERKLPSSLKFDLR